MNEAKVIVPPPKTRVHARRCAGLNFRNWHFADFVLATCGSDMVLMASGDRRFPYYGNKALADFPAIIQHQLVQKSTELIEVRLVARRRLTTEETERLRLTMRTALGHSFDIHFVYCDAIARTASGKFEEFRCEIASS